MQVRKAVITAAGPKQRALPLQTLIDRDGEEKSLLLILLQEAISAGIEEIAVVVASGDEPAYGQAAGEAVGRVRFLCQDKPLGYAHAVWCARSFTGGEPFLHMVGDHLPVSRSDQSCAQRVVAIAESEACSISAVQATREHQLPYFGAIGGKPVAGKEGLIEVELVREKPTPTEAEQWLMVPGLRAGHYLCFFGIHVLTPATMEILERQLAENGRLRSFSDTLNELARRERYLALELHDRRYDVGARYGLLHAQLALALSGKDRDGVLSQLVELLALRELDTLGR
jgi:UTP--glucose-1-phosphate uridylyltransferase